MQHKSIADLYQQVNGSVVVITAFGRSHPGSQNGESNIERGLGSGVIISEDGLVITASHIVHVADRVVVKLLDGREIEAEIISSVPPSDLALLRLRGMPKGLTIAKIGNSGAVRTGDQIFVVGAPYGIDHTMSVGHISGRLDSQKVANDAIPLELLQIDAAINPGNSGGPIFNMKGEVVGIVSHILSQSGGFEGLGFGVAIDTAKKILLEKDPFWDGLEFMLASGELAEALNVPQEAGLLVLRVAYGSPADRGGLRPGKLSAIVDGKQLILGGDIILEVNNNPIPKDLKTLVKQFEEIRSTPNRNRIIMKVLRSGKIVELTMTK